MQPNVVQPSDVQPSDVQPSDVQPSDANQVMPTNRKKIGGFSIEKPP
ncbi:MAG: hypothetical protein P8R31_14450 [Mariniblastus sp.]|nr:hypothetical protein [Mariniblastus sp.]